MISEMLWEDIRGMFGHYGKHFVQLSDMEDFAEMSFNEPIVKPDVYVLRNNTSNDLNTFYSKGVQMHNENGVIKTGICTMSKDSTSNDNDIREHVWSQISLLKEGNYVGAFAMNSQSNQERIGNSVNFEKIVKNNTGFKLLADERSVIKFDKVDGDCNETSTNDNIHDNRNKVSFRVFCSPHHANSAQEALTFMFDLSFLSTCGKWQTDGVRICC